MGARGSRLAAQALKKHCGAHTFLALSRRSRGSSTQLPPPDGHTRPKASARLSRPAPPQEEREPAQEKRGKPLLSGQNNVLEPKREEH
jgi:hypothetical protein